MTSLNRKTQETKPGQIFLDTNVVLNEKILVELQAQKVSGVLRYVPRINKAVNDISKEELDLILSLGLAAIPVQHVEPMTWIPSSAKGKKYGSAAAGYATEAGFVTGTSLFLDLESVDAAVPGVVTIAYCNAWFDEVSKAGFLPGIYIGWRCGLTPYELYHRLKFTRYWRAYNLDDDELPEQVGTCMTQEETPRILGISFDKNTVTGDKLGRLPFATVVE